VILRTLAAKAKDAGVEIQEISVGSTPTARFITLQTGATEMRPGNYVFFDRTQVGLRATSVESCALSIVSMVVSRPAPARVVFDAGSKTLTSDGVRGFGTPTGHGLVFSDLEASSPDGTIAIERPVRGAFGRAGAGDVPVEARAIACASFRITRAR
jgi:D-serine deaminase-like pyridoxal phosphate-dependent protein